MSQFLLIRCHIALWLKIKIKNLNLNKSVTILLSLTYAKFVQNCLPSWALKPIKQYLSPVSVVSTVVSGILFARFPIVECISKRCSFLLWRLFFGFFGNKTVNQHFGANLKKRVFCKILLQISCFLKLFSTKNAENDYFDQIWSAQHPNAGQNIQQTSHRNFHSRNFFYAFNMITSLKVLL